MWQLISFTKRGAVRREILALLVKGAATPAELSKLTKKPRPSVSRALIALANKELAICLTPDEKLSRIYIATKTGRQVLEKSTARNAP